MLRIDKFLTGFKRLVVPAARRGPGRPRKVEQPEGVDIPPEVVARLEALRLRKETLRPPTEAVEVLDSEDEAAAEAVEAPAAVQVKLEEGGHAGKTPVLRPQQEVEPQAETRRQLWRVGSD